MTSPCATGCTGRAGRIEAAKAESALVRFLCPGPPRRARLILIPAVSCLPGPGLVRRPPSQTRHDTTRALVPSCAGATANPVPARSAVAFLITTTIASNQGGVLPELTKASEIAAVQRGHTSSCLFSASAPRSRARTRNTDAPMRWPNRRPPTRTRGAAVASSGARLDLIRLDVVRDK